MYIVTDELLEKEMQLLDQRLSSGELTEQQYEEQVDSLVNEYCKTR